MMSQPNQDEMRHHLFEVVPDHIYRLLSEDREEVEPDPFDEMRDDTSFELGDMVRILRAEADWLSPEYLFEKEASQDRRPLLVLQVCKLFVPPPLERRLRAPLLAILSEGAEQFFQSRDIADEIPDDEEDAVSTGRPMTDEEFELMLQQSNAPF